MSNLKHFGQHPHSLLMELLASVIWMSSSYDSLDISVMSDKLIYNFRGLPKLMLLKSSSP